LSREAITDGGDPLGRARGAFGAVDILGASVAEFLLNRGICNEWTRRKPPLLRSEADARKVVKIAKHNIQRTLTQIREPRRNNLRVPLHGASGENNPRGETFREN
jgi:hypothetical protein